MTFMTKRSFTLYIAAAVFAPIVCFSISCPDASAQNVPSLFDRPGGLVPDEETAIKIAEAVLFPVYGEKHIRDERPYVVKLSDGKWVIDGSLAQPTDPQNRVVGGTFHIVISQRDARVIEIGHGA
jgi:hypothetical protein